MIVLGIDCTLDNCAIAISQNGEELAQKNHASKNNHAEVLPNMVFETLKELNISPKELGKIAVTTGPGSFTGVRIGLSFAKSLALSLNIPCIGLNSLEVFAVSSAQMRAIPIICVAGSVFMAAYENRTIVLQPTRFEDFSALKDFDDSWTLCGQGAQLAKLEYGDFNALEYSFINPFILCTLAQDLDGKSAPPSPLYLRGADVKPWAGHRPQSGQSA